MSTKAITLRWAALVGLAIPALAAVPARPGTLNFIEGKVSVDGRDLTSQSVGSAGVPAGSVLRTESGKAEVLLTPGIFLRLGSNSEIRIISAGLLDTRIAVTRGAALLEATDLRKENHIQVASSGLNSHIKDEGLYRFDTGTSSVAVFDGKAEIRQGDEKVEAKKGKAVVATEENEPIAVQKFDVKEAKKTDELYQWSNLRSKYLADASAVTARNIIVQPGLWAGSGWYWNPYLRSYSWLPEGNSYFSPFGYGFYSPWSYYSRPMYVVPRYRMQPRMRGPVPGRMGGGMGPRRPRANMGRVSR